MEKGNFRIIEQKIYKEDYQNLTEALLEEDFNGLSNYREFML